MYKVAHKQQIYYIIIKININKRQLVLKQCLCSLVNIHSPQFNFQLSTLSNNNKRIKIFLIKLNLL